MKLNPLPAFALLLVARHWKGAAHLLVRGLRGSVSRSVERVPPERGTEMASIATDVHDRIEQLERQLHGRQFAGELSAQIDRLERLVGQSGFVGRRQPPPVAGFPAGLAVGALAGGLVGAGVALLLARRAGRETREQLQQAGTDLAARANALATELRAEGQALRQQTQATLDAVRAEVASRREPVPAATGVIPTRDSAAGVDEPVGGTA